MIEAAAGGAALVKDRMLPDSVVTKAQDVCVRIGGKTILTALAFEVERGTVLGIIGPNGSGKTTLLRALGGNQPYTGSLLLDGREVREYAPRALARKLAYVRQTPSLAFDYEVREVVLLGRSVHKGLLGGFDRQDEESVHRALVAVGLDAYGRRSILTLSGGELQRVFLAQALVQETPVLLLDEPTAHLDIHHRFDLLRRIRAFADEGRTALAVLHDLELAARFADRLLVLDRGKIVAQGPPETVLSENLIARVFRMKARVDVAAGRVERVRFEEPLAG